MLSVGITHLELRDEIFSQLVKQLSQNPNLLVSSSFLALRSQRRPFRIIHAETAARSQVLRLQRMGAPVRHRRDLLAVEELCRVPQDVHQGYY